MKKVIATTYGGAKIKLNAKAYKKAVKACIVRGNMPPSIHNPTYEQTVLYLRAKSNSFQHALDVAGLYSMKIVNKQVFVI
jgi:hypothetical protein